MLTPEGCVLAVWGGTLTPEGCVLAVWGGTLAPEERVLVVWGGTLAPAGCVLVVLGGTLVPAGCAALCGDPSTAGPGERSLSVRGVAPSPAAEAGMFCSPLGISTLRAGLRSVASAIMFTGSPGSDSNEAVRGSVTPGRRTGTVAVFGTGRAGGACAGVGGMAMLTSATAASRFGTARTGGPTGLGAGDGASVRPGTATSRGRGLGKSGACRAQKASGGRAVGGRVICGRGSG